MLNVNDLYTYYNAIDPASDSPKILITDWYVYWDVDYYEYVDTTLPSDIDVKVYSANDTLVHSDGFSITDDIGLTFSQWASHFSEPGYSVEVTDSRVRLTYTSGSDTYSGNIYDGINPVTGSTVIAQGTTYGATLNYVEPIPSDPKAALVGVWIADYSSGYFDFDDIGSKLLVYSSTDTGLNIGTVTLRNSSTEPIVIGWPENGNYIGLWARLLYGTTSYLAYFIGGSSVQNKNLNDLSSIEFTDSILDSSIVVDPYFYDFIETYFNKASPASVMNLSDEPVAAASGEWVKVDSDKRNIVQIGYPLYDTSSGDPDYAALLSYPDFDNFLKGSTIDIPTVPGYPGEPDKEVSSLTRWLGVAVSGFTDVELWEGFSIGGVLAIIVSFSVVMMFLKVFAGG